MEAKLAASFLRVDHANKTIIVRATFEKKVGTYGTDEYHMLQKVRRDFPTYGVSIADHRKSKTSDKFKGLTYKYMKDYLDNKKDENLIKAFKILTSKDDDIVASYMEVREWFLEHCPEIEEYRKNRKAEINKILGKLDDDDASLTTASAVA